MSIEKIIEIPVYVLAVAGAIITFFKWVVHRYQKNQNDLREEYKRYVSEEITRVEYFHKDYDNIIRNMEKSISHIASKVSLLDSVQQDIAVLKTSMEFLKQMMWGTKVKSEPDYLSGLSETKKHYDMKGTGIFKDTEEEAEDRKNL